jgi:hypothetical protein
LKNKNIQYNRLIFSLIGIACFSPILTSCSPKADYRVSIDYRYYRSEIEISCIESKSRAIVNGDASNMIEAYAQDWENINDIGQTIAMKVTTRYRQHFSMTPMIIFETAVDYEDAVKDAYKKVCRL